jgi:predicted Zn-ribbon and HTH transcriptional regulator
VFRRDLIDRLLDSPTSVVELARETGARPNEVEDDLRHLLRSLKHQPYRAVVTPARCRKCGFTFHADKLTKPGKCPECHGTWISEPLVAIEPQP